MPQGRRWLRTGDIGRLDDEGFLYLVDRKKDLILSGGQNIYPADLEPCCCTHPDVAEVAVIGVPSERWGETPLAVVVRAAWQPIRRGAASRLGQRSASASSSASAASCCGTRCRATRTVRSSSANCARNTCAHESHGRGIDWTPVTGRNGSSPPPTACGSTAATTLRSSAGRVPVLCLPGLTRNCRDFEATALRLRRTRRVLSPDLRGRGRSQYDPNWQNYHPRHLSRRPRRGCSSDAAVDA